MSTDYVTNADPFGHASEFANLAAQMGFDALYFSRVEYACFYHYTI
jgi:hypothetical protein